MTPDYPPGMENHPLAPYNQEEEDPREELHQRMCDFLEEQGSSADTLELRGDGWYYKIANVERGSYQKLSTKYWLVAKD